MNERIRQLAEQATIHSPEGFYTYTQIDAKKFAELIVRECAEIADNADATREKWEGIGKYVREHFGVEE